MLSVRSGAGELSELARSAMTRPQSTAEDARNAMVAGLLASGISVNGLQPSHNPQVASQMFNTATALDPAMCDAWLARVLAGEQNIDVLAGAWAAVRTFGWETRRLGVTDLQFRPEVSDGLFLRLAITSVESLACAYAAVLAEAKRYDEAAKLLDGIDPRHPFDEEVVTLRAGRAVLPHRALARRARSISRGKVLASPRTEGRGRGDGDHCAGVTGGLRGSLPARRGSRRG